MVDLGIVVTSGLGLVFVVAAVGKLASIKSMMDVLIGVPELILGILLFIQIGLLVVGVASLIISLAYTARAVIRPGECACFGQRLPSTSRRGQIVRNSFMTTLAIATVTITASSTGNGGADFPWVDFSLGLVVGAGVVVGPWIVRWLRQDEVIFGA